jgi:hypothetical protein
LEDRSAQRGNAVKLNRMTGNRQLATGNCFS